MRTSRTGVHVLPLDDAQKRRLFDDLDNEMPERVVLGKYQIRQDQLRLYRREWLASQQESKL